MPRGKRKEGESKDTNWRNPILPARGKKPGPFNVQAVTNYRPYTDFKIENSSGLQPNEVYLSPILKDGEVIGTLITADDKYLYGVIDFEKIIVNLEIDFGNKLSFDSGRQFEEAYENIEIKKERKNEFKTQDDIKKELQRYKKWRNIDRLNRTGSEKEVDSDLE